MSVNPKQYREIDWYGYVLVVVEKLCIHRCGIHYLDSYAHACTHTHNHKQVFQLEIVDCIYVSASWLCS